MPTPTAVDATTITTPALGADPPDIRDRSQGLLAVAAARLLAAFLSWTP
ncbi:hypothetical protein ACIA5G_39670 [Amycolatopsis sp. NPDC051758]